MPSLEARKTSVEYVEQPCKSALNAVRGMPFKWSLNPYMGCEHRCTFCYVRAFEKRAERPSDDRYGRTIRVKVNIASVLRVELGRRGWAGETVVIGAATDPYQPAEGTYRLTRACLGVLADHANPTGIITRGPMIVRDIDVLTHLARRAELGVTFSVPTLDDEVWRRTEPGTAHPRRRLEALSRLVAAGVKANVGMRPSCLAFPTGPRSWKRWWQRRGRPAPVGSGPTCSTSGPAPRSISWSPWPGTGRSC